jgi:hypothetical protein
MIGNRLPLRDAFMKYYDLKSIKAELVQLIVDKCSNSNDRARGEKLLAAGTGKDNAFLQEYLSQREIADLFDDFQSSVITLQELMPQMKLLQPRYYSISSSPNITTDCSVVSVTAAVVRYETLGKPRFPHFFFLLLQTNRQQTNKGSPSLLMFTSRSLLGPEFAQHLFQIASRLDKIVQCLLAK